MWIIKAIVNRLFILAYGMDQLLSGILFLKPDHTVSGEVGYAASQGKRWGLMAESLIDAMPWFGEGHCRNSIEWDEVLKPPFKFWV